MNGPWIDSAGNLELHRQYDAFGRVTSQTGAATDFLFGFTGRWLDQDTGLQNNRHRWYDARVGRWLSEDPLSFDAGDTNLYRYSGNDPVGNVDPSGLGFKGIMGAVGSALASGLSSLASSYLATGQSLGGIGAAAFDSSFGTNLVGLGSPMLSPSLMYIDLAGPTAFQQGVRAYNMGGSLYAMAQQQAVNAQASGWVQDIAREQLINPWQFATSQPSYLERTVESLLLGDYSQQNPTLASVGIGMGMGLVGADLPMDLRDLSANLVNWEWSRSHVGKTLLTGAAVLPVVGMVKYLDDFAAVGKNMDGVVDIAKNAPSGGASLESLLRANMKRTNPSAFSTAQKGALGEARTSLTMRRAGYEELSARLPGNQGFDGVWIRRGADGSIADIIITESKFSSSGTLQLSNTATMGRQLSSTWIDGNIQRMLNSADPALVRSGMLLQTNRSMIRAKAAVLDPQGILRFSTH